MTGVRMKRLTAIAFTLVLSVAACGGSDTDTGATPTTDAPQDGITTVASSPTNEVSLDDPCAIVDDETISATLGKAVTGSNLGVGLCAYVPTDGSGGVELLIQDVSAVGCDVIFDAGGFSDEELVDSVGTYARYNADASGGTHQMAVCFDEQYSLVTVMYADTPTAKETLIGIADAVGYGLGY